MQEAEQQTNEARLRYQVYRCEYLRYEAYRWAGLVECWVVALGQLSLKHMHDLALHSQRISTHEQVQATPGAVSWLAPKLPACVCSRLQSTSVAIGESFPIPEIVAIGGQSDGKSSLLEAFLGVRWTQGPYKRT
jgi:hypothetical protein